MIIGTNNKYNAPHNCGTTRHPLALEALINFFFIINIPYIINK
jgi:hypothetical protein